MVCSDVGVAVVSESLFSVAGARHELARGRLHTPAVAVGALLRHEVATLLVALQVKHTYTHTQHILFSVITPYNSGCFNPHQMTEVYKTSRGQIVPFDPGN